MIRFVICVDVEEDDVAKAYGLLRDGMKQSTLGWESTDEWYKPGGDQGNSGELQQAINIRLESPSDGPPYDAATATGMYDRD